MNRTIATVFPLITKGILFLGAAFFIQSMAGWDGTIAKAASENSGLPKGFSYCKDYFTENSLAPFFGKGDMGEVEAGSKVQNNIFITNSNKAPIGEVDVFASVFRDTDGESQAISYPITIIKVANKISFGPNEKKEILFEWNVPANIEAGAYHVRIHARAHERFDLFGGSQIADAGNIKSVLKIRAGNGESVFLDRASVTVDGKKYDANGIPVAVDPQVIFTPIYVDVNNTSKTAVAKGNVVWDLYEGLDASPPKFISSSKSQIKLLPGEKTKAAYQFLDKQYKNYVLIGRLETEDGFHEVVVIGIKRSVDENFYIAPKPSFHFTGSTQYPSEDDKASAFLCFDPQAFWGKENTSIELFVNDGESGNELGNAKYKYSPEFDVPNSLLAISVPVKKTTSSYIVKALLREDDRIIDEISVPYNKTMLGDKAENNKGIMKNLKKDRLVAYIFFAIAAVLLPGLIYVFRKYKISQSNK